VLEVGGLLGDFVANAKAMRHSQRPIELSLGLGQRRLLVLAASERIVHPSNNAKGI
jgi:hypothetical protein